MKNQYPGKSMYPDGKLDYKNLRFDTARALTAVLILGLLAVTAARADTLDIAGTGASQTLLRQVAERFQSDHPECRTTVPDSVGSRGGIRQLLAGQTDLARVSRPPKKKEKDQGLVYKSFAATQVVFVIHPSVTGVESLSLPQLLDIYAGRIRNWREVGGPDHEIYPLTRDGGTTLRTVLKHVPGFEKMPARAKATYSSLETKKLLIEHPFTIGFLPMTITVDTPLKTIAIDGISTGRSLVEKPAIPLELGIVHKEPLSKCGARFFEFLHTDDARRIIKDNHAIPVAK